MMLKKRFCPLGLATTMGLIAFSSSTESLAESAPPRIDILHLWAAESEQKALGVFRQPAVDAGVIWQETPVGSIGNIQVELSNMMTIGENPSIVHWVVDPQLKKLVERKVFNEIPDPEGHFKALYIPEVYDMVATENGGIISAPVGIHSYNFLVYNKALLEEYGWQPAESLDQLIEYGKTLREDGKYLSSISTQSWQLRYPLVSAFSTQFDIDEIHQLFANGADISKLRPQLVASFEIFKSFLELSEPNTKDQDWTMGVEKIEDGKALVLFMGDFAVPQFEDQEGIICQRAPSSKDFYFGLDSFAFPVTDDEALLAGQKRFLELTTDPKLVANYVNLKGGLPTIRGVNPDDLLPCHAENLADWETAGKIRVHSDRYVALTEFLAVQIKRDELDPELMADELINLFNSFY